MDFVGGAFDAGDERAGDEGPGGLRGVRDDECVFEIDVDADAAAGAHTDAAHADAAAGAHADAAHADAAAGDAAVGKTILRPPRAPPSGQRPAGIDASMLRAARRHPGGGSRRAAWVAVTGFADAWATAFFEVAPLPEEVVCHVDEFREYCWQLHRGLATAYRWHDVAMPRWRSWDSLARRWPVLGSAGSAAGACKAAPPLRRVHAQRPLV